MEWLPQRLFLK